LSLEQTKEYQLSQKLEPFVDDVYRKVFNPTEIIRSDKGGELDKKFHVDTYLRLPSNILATFQEKTLSYKYRTFNTVTIEYYQNRHTKELGEFFNLASQFYFHGYENEKGNGLSVWHIFKTYPLLMWIYYNLELCNIRSAAGSNASFISCDYKLLPREVFFR